MRIKQIKEGFVKSDKKTYILACSSVTLIKDKKLKILVDTGGKGFFKEIKNNLKKEGINPKEITHVINTHSHPDHTWNNAFFENAEFISSGGILKDKFYWKKLPINIGKIIEIISTPGHSEDSCSVIVKIKKDVYAITGDLFFTNKEKIPSFEKNVEEIKKNRQLILKKANFIIPGHGKMFRV